MEQVRVLRIRQAKMGMLKTRGPFHGYLTFQQDYRRVICQRETVGLSIRRRAVRCPP